MFLDNSDPGWQHPVALAVLGGYPLLWPYRPASPRSSSPGLFLRLVLLTEIPRIPASEGRLCPLRARQARLQGSERGLGQASWLRRTVFRACAPRSGRV